MTLLNFDLPPDPCCKDLAQSLKNGTDNEMYGSALNWWAGAYHLGCDLPDVRFCPWCGAKLPQGEGQTPEEAT